MKRRSDLPITMRASSWYGSGLVATLILICATLLAFQLLQSRGNRHTGAEALRPLDTELPAQSTGGRHATTVTIDEAYVALCRYLDQLGNPNYVIKEIIEFEYNFHASVIDGKANTGIAELLIDKTGGPVGPEMGPNMMWSSRSLHHDGPRLGRTNPFARMSITEREALSIATSWLETHRAGAVAANATRFDRYYTLHVLRDSVTEGLLSVNATTGHVWYHTWHGEFVRTLKPEPGRPESAFPEQIPCMARATQA